MAEDLVLANLIINADGTVTATDKAGKAILNLERQTTSSVKSMEHSTKSAFTEIGLSGKKLTEGFLRTRELLRGLFVGFSVGGAVLALAELARQAIFTSQAFDRLKEKTIDLVNEFVVSEDAVTRFERHLKGMGVTGAQASQQAIDKLKDSVFEMQALLDKGFRKDPTGFTSEGFHIGLGNIKLTQQEINLLTKDIAESKLKIEEMSDALSKLGTRPGTPVAKGAAQHFPAGQFVGPLLSQLKELPPTLQEQIIAWNQLQAAVDAMGDPFQQIVQSQVEIIENGPLMVDILNEQSLAAVRASDAYALVAIGLQTFAQGLVEAAAGSEISGKKLLAAVLKAVAGEAAARGAFYILEGIARGFSSYGFDATAYGLIATGTKMLALGVALGAAAGAIGGRTQSGSGGGGSDRFGRESQAPTQEMGPPSRAAQQVTIVIDGNGMFIGSPDELGRTIAELLGKTKLDNVKAA